MKIQPVSHTEEQQRKGNWHEQMSDPGCSSCKGVLQVSSLSPDGDSSSLQTICFPIACLPSPKNVQSTKSCFGRCTDRQTTKVCWEAAISKTPEHKVAASTVWSGMPHADSPEGLGLEKKKSTKNKTLILELWKSLAMFAAKQASNPQGIHFFVYSDESMTN